MELRKFTYIVLTAAVAGSLAVSSCKNGTGGQATANDSLSQHQIDSIDSVFWSDSCYHLHVQAADYYNASYTDSLEMFVPGALKTCLEHNELERYYIIWGLLAGEYVWDNDFEKGVAEAQRIQEDALKRDCEYGLFVAYKVLSDGYASRGNNEETVMYMRKAIDHYHARDFAPIMLPYNILTDALNRLKRYEACDSALTEWKAILDRNRVGEESVSFRPWANGTVLYSLRAAEYLMEKEQYQVASAALDTAEYYCSKIPDATLNHGLVMQAKSRLADAQEDYHAALRYAQKTYDLSVKDGIINNQQTAMIAQVNALHHLGRYREALETLLKHDEIRDSVYEISNAEQLNELNKKYEVNELKWQAERDKMQAERRQMYLLAAIVAVVLIAIILFILSRLHAARRLAKMRAAQERLESELRIARDIQMSMVPSVFPEREGLDMYASMTPAKEVGGDLYGYLLMGDKLYFAVGDVSGKGVPASLFMAQATRLFLTLAKQGMMPAEICTRMNDALSGDDNENGMFVTFWLGLLDLTTGHLDFCNAGHNPPVIGGGEHHGEFLKMIPNAPIGLWPELEYEGEEIESIKGRPLFIYTDGLNEAEDPEQKQFGDERLLDILRNPHFDSARQVIDTLKSEVETHRNGAEPNDDLTMMCLRVN